MAGKKMAGSRSGNRKSKYAAHPAKAVVNKRQRLARHVRTLEKKIKHIASRLERGVISAHAAENTTKRIQKEIAYCTEESKRPDHKTGREAQLLHVQKHVPSKSKES